MINVFSVLTLLSKKRWNAFFCEAVTFFWIKLRNCFQEYLLRIDYETASNIKKENTLNTYKEFYFSKMDSLYKGFPVGWFHNEYSCCGWLQYYWAFKIGDEADNPNKNFRKLLLWFREHKRTYYMTEYSLANAIRS